MGDAPTVAQVVDWERSLSSNGSAEGSPPPVVERLAATVSRSTLEPVSAAGPNLHIPFGLDDRTRSVAALTLRPGEHALIAGPPGSGRTAALSTLAVQLRRSDPDLVLVAVTPSGADALSELDVVDASGTATDLEHVLRRAIGDDRRWVILVDDADRIQNSPALEELVTASRPGLHVLAAVRSASVRSMYSHWTRHVRASGIGVILQPDNGADGELLGVRLPRGERLPELPGRGYRVAAGLANVVQVAR